MSKASYSSLPKAKGHTAHFSVSVIVSHFQLRFESLVSLTPGGRLKPKLRQDSFVCHLRVASVSSKSHGAECPADANAVSSANK